MGLNNKGSLLRDNYYWYVKNFLNKYALLIKTVFKMNTLFYRKYAFSNFT